MLGIKQKITQEQRLTPQQIQYQQLLLMNNLSLEEKIQEEIELNPLLEEQKDSAQDTNEDYESRAEEELKSEFEEDKSSKADDFDYEDYMNDFEYEFIKSNRNPDLENFTPIAKYKSSLKENLIDQLHMLDLTDDELLIGELIIESLDEGGYFVEDLNEFTQRINFSQNLNFTETQVEKIIKQIQLLEPIGNASRNLQECLLVQLKNCNYDEYYSFLAEKIITNYYNDFVNKKYSNITKELELTEETLKKTLELIQKLNPKPGEGNISSEEANQITPDFIIEKLEKEYIITLNDKNLPSLTINESYLEMIEQNKHKKKIAPSLKETHKFLREKFESARWFIEAINQRRDTLLKIMRSIFERQFQFFIDGPKALKPMIYKDIADEIGMDISTISRAVNNKYVQSSVGIHELKYFFSEGLTTDSGDDISNTKIKELIKDIIKNEPAKSPYSDDKIAEILQARGIHIARRTVTKYREQLKIPIARFRKNI
ncbi:MAG: RNA polymerase factor sigma-54 [Ignavibacteriales bacterium]|nr:RNA polymerase factor sigma-54 [Ignavibacteriales bacterium]